MEKKYQIPADCPYLLKGFKHLEGMSDETLCFEATLYKGKVKVALVGNAGHGGCNDLHFINAEEEKAFGTYAANLEPDTYEMAGEAHTILMDSEYLITLMADACAEAAFEKKESKRWTKYCQESTVYRAAEDKPGAWHRIWMRRPDGSKRPLTPEEIQKHITGKGVEIGAILNDILAKNPMAWKEC